MTVKQAQCLLLYLGYSPGTPDNVSGAKTSGAASAFQADYGLPVTGKLDETTGKMLIAAVAGTAVKVEKPQTGSWWDDIKYFKPSAAKMLHRRGQGDPEYGYWYDQQSCIHVRDYHDRGK